MLRDGESLHAMWSGVLAFPNEEVPGLASDHPSLSTLVEPVHRGECHIYVSSCLRGVRLTAMR